MGAVFAPCRDLCTGRQATSEHNSKTGSFRPYHSGTLGSFILQAVSVHSLRLDTEAASKGSILNAGEFAPSRDLGQLVLFGLCQSLPFGPPLHEHLALPQLLLREHTRARDGVLAACEHAQYAKL